MFTRKYTTSMSSEIILAMFRDEIGDWEIEDTGLAILNDSKWKQYKCYQWKKLGLNLLWKDSVDSSAELVLCCENEKSIRRGQQILKKLNFEDKEWLVRKILSGACDNNRMKEFEVWVNFGIISIGLISTVLSLILRVVGNDQTWLLTGLSGISSGFLWGMYKFGSMREAVDIQFLSIISGVLLAVYVFPVSLFSYISLDWLQYSLMIEGPFLFVAEILISTGALVPTFFFLRDKANPILESKWTKIRKNIYDPQKKLYSELPIIENKLGELVTMNWFLGLLISWVFVLLFQVSIIAERIVSFYGDFYLLFYPIILFLFYYLIIRDSFSVGRIAAARKIAGYPNDSLMIYLDSIPMKVSPSWINRKSSLEFIKEEGKTDTASPD